MQDDLVIAGKFLDLINFPDLAVASRYTAGGSATEGLSPIRKWGSELATRLANSFIGTQVSDPMSGFFMVRREIIEKHAVSLAGEGYKVLMDILWTAGKSLRVTEIPYRFRERLAGESKLDTLVAFDYLGLLFSKLFGGVLPVRFLIYVAITALTRMLVIDAEKLADQRVLTITGAILILALASLAVDYSASRFRPADQDA